MARPKNYPYSQFNFLVTWDNIKGETVDAGFQEVSGLGLEVNVTEYRAGDAKTNEPIKVTTSSKAADATFKRGVVGAHDLYEWIDSVRDGKLYVQPMRDGRKAWRLKRLAPERFYDSLSKSHHKYRQRRHKS